MPFSDLALSRRLEQAEGFACAQFAEANRRLHPENGAEWIECAGVYAVFNGVDSPVTQTFGLGLSEEWNESWLDSIEQFFLGHGASVVHEVSPFAGTEVLDLLIKRNYHPVEISNVVYRSVEQPTDSLSDPIHVHVIAQEEASLWSDVSARGWSHEHPELREFLLDFGPMVAASRMNRCFLASYDGVPGAAGALCVNKGVALFGGSATVPELRRHGLQSALLHERMRYAFEHECDLAMMVAFPGSDSQRNAERKGFRIAYTRTKWKLHNA